MTDHPGSENAYEVNKPTTGARDHAQAVIENLRSRGGVFVDAVRATRMPMVLTDPHQPGNPIVFANQSFTDLSGYTLEEVLGQQPHFMDGTGTDNLDAGRFRQILEEDKDGVVETVQYRKDGSRFVATVLLSAFKDAAGKTLHHFLSWSDVTRRSNAEREVAELRAKQAEEKLRGSEERLGLAVQVGRLGTWDWDLRTNEVAWNDRHFSIQGYAVNEVKPSFEAWFARVHPEDRTETIALIEKARDDKAEYAHEFRSLHADDGVVWCSARGRFFYDEDGNPVRMIGVMEDITQRKRVEHALRDSEERLHLAVEAANLAIYDWDLVSGHVTANERFRDMVSVGPDEPFVGARVLEFGVHPDDRDRIDLELSKAMNSVSDGRYAFEHRLGKQAGRDEQWVLSHGQVYFGDRGGELSAVRVFGTLQDITERKRAETALRESEVRHRYLIGSWAQAVWETDATGVVTVDSPSWRAYTGQTVDEWLGYGWLNAIHPDDRVFAEKQWREAIAARRLVNADFRLRSPDRGWRWTNVRAIPLLDANGIIEKWAGMNIDIDERKRAEDALFESKERLRLIVESARDYAIFTMDTERKIDNWLPGAEAVFGWKRDEIEGRSADVLFTPEDRDHAAPQTETETALHEGHAPDVRWHLHKNGHRVFIEGQSVPLFEGGRHSGFLKIGQDVTSRRAAREALQQSEERLRQFGEASQDVLWARDPDTLQWTYLTPAFEAIYGMSRDEVLSGNNFHNWVEMILPEDREGALASIEKVRQGERVTFEYRILRPTDGAVRWLRDTDFPIFDEAGRVARIGGIGQDVTEDKETADRMAVLVAELQHRTRNLMGVVRSTARRTAETSADLLDFRDRFADRIEALARVQGLLSRLGDTDRVSFDVLIRTELKAMHGSDDRVTLVGPRGIRLRSGMVQTLAMALHELATNAVKYGALGQQSGHLTITWQMVDRDVRGRPRLYIEWQESGVEMPVGETRAQGGGQGRELIEKALPYQLNAETSFELGSDGIRCTIMIPVSESNHEETRDG